MKIFFWYQPTCIKNRSFNKYNLPE